MSTARKQNRSVLGFKGISPLPAMPDFNVIDDGFAIDYMHAVLLGIVKRLLKLWFDPQSRKKSTTSTTIKKYNIRKHIGKINERILKVKLMPSEIERKPRPITEKSTWKDNELRAWLLFYSSGVMRIIRAAREHKNFFVDHFEEYYGIENMVYNTHTMQHLPDCVDNLEPIWVYSNFAFENNNGKLMRYVNSPKGVLK